MSNYKRFFNISANLVFITFVTYNRREIIIPNIENSGELPCEHRKCLECPANALCVDIY